MRSDPTRPSRFFDPETNGTMRLQLEPDRAEFRMLRQIGYRDPHHGEPFVVPRDLEGWRTDLASIPWVFAWLVPGLGTHLPAVLVHDGLVLTKGEPPSHDGPAVTREEADRILRDAMASLGTPLIRRWLIWTATAMATALVAMRPAWYWRAVVIGTLLVVVTLGVLATLDLLDVWDLLPWMGDRPWWAELVLGAVFAVLIPLALSVLWRHIWRAGAIAGVALAFLLHVTAAIAAVYGIYWLAEKVVSGTREGTGPDVRENLEEADRSRA